MKFGEAIEALKEGKHVRRIGWNGKNMHLYLEEHFKFIVHGGALANNSKEYEPCIVMFTAQGKHQPGWFASQSDMLAEDWIVVSF